MNDMEIQREAIVEIVGTQYEGRSVNHQNLNLQQSLVMKHQSENIHDHNAVAIFTKEGKELGFMPKGYASIYAPAIDSGRYNFAVEIVKTELDAERPILIVKITSELKNYSEEDIEKDILGFVRNIVNGYMQSKTEYLKFIYAESVNTKALFATLNKVRVFQKLYSYSKDIIQSQSIEQTSEEYTSITKDSLTEYIKELKDYVNDALKKIQKAYNESLDIDDEEEYHRVQSELREKRKKFRSFDGLLTCYQEVANNFTSIEKVEETDSEIAIENNVSELQEIVEDTSDLSEQAFLTWLISNDDVSESTAKQYISNIHSIEKLYQTLFGMRNNLFGTNSADNARAMIESLIVKNEYIDANERRHNSFGTALAKFAQFADISVIGFNQSVEKKNCKSLVSSEPFTVRTVDFNNPHNCTYYKPCSFILNGLTYTAGSWKELYTKFLVLLYTDNTYSETIKGLIGKSLYGHRIDFADKNLYFRKPIEVSTNFFAEGNLSAMEIIKHIKCLIELCAISNDNMVIKYSVQEKNNEPKVSANTSTGKDKQLSIPSVPEEAVAKTSTPVIHTKTATNSIINESKLVTVATFTPDTTKSFILKNAVIEILSSDAPEITKHREHRNGISSKSLRELIKEYYGKTIGFFEISKLLMIDKAFKSIGRGCYILNEATLPQKAETEYSELATIETKKEESIEISDKQVYTEKTVDTASEHSLTIKSILEVIKENSGNLQYEDGFGAYEVKTLLSQKGVADVSEEQIEALMSACSELQQIEDGYYSLIDDESYGDSSTESIVVMENTPDNTADMDTTDNTDIQEISHSDADERQIVLRLNGNTVRAYDYSDALSKVCEFSINCKPFKMARITGQAIQIHGNNVFYRQAVPVDGYNKLSNGLQIITITTLLDLQTITTEIQKYCQIDDDMITIISR